MIEKVIFNKFRDANNLEIQIGKNLTIIAGQNGTMKSTLLACIGQPFGIERGKNNDAFIGENLDNCKIINNSFKTRINEIFKLSPTYDIPGTHEFEIYFTDKLPTDIIYENPLQVKSYLVNDRNPPIRFVAGKSRSSGKGNLPIPVIYLGLSRIYPLGESDINKQNILLDEEEKNFLYTNYQKILLSYGEKYTDISEISKNKKLKTIGISTTKYDWNSISAGQDNLGKIITTILEFKRLKKEFKEKYYGGIILIDELETTLYPKAQKELVKFLNKQCSDLKLKIICTTHSLEIIKECIEDEAISRNTKINFLDKTRGKLINKQIVSYDDIVKNLLVLPKKQQKQEQPKISIYTEDMEGSWLLKKILSNEILQYINIIPLGLGHSEIAKVSLKINELKEGVVVYDRDVKDTYAKAKSNSELKKNMNKSENYLFLPGKKSLEEDFIEILENIEEDNNVFWDNCRNDNKQLALSSLEKYNLSDRNSRKKWFNDERKNYGRDGKEILDIWMTKNENSIDEFKNEFIEKLKKYYLNKFGISILKQEIKDNIRNIGGEKCQRRVYHH